MPAYFLRAAHAALFVAVSVIFAQVRPPASPSNGLLVTAIDENGLAVPGARVTIGLAHLPTLPCETDFAGHCRFWNISAGDYRVHIEKAGFYALTLPAVRFPGTANLEVTLSHQQEVREVVNVIESPPAIDPAQIPSVEKLSGLDILNLPYPNTRDYRNALNFIPGVVNDSFGQPHVAGSETYQTLTLFDGFNITQPANGQLLARISTDAFRSVEVETTRLPAEYGKGSAGVLALNAGIGDDHYRFIATNFTPSLQNKKGVELDSIDPRLTFSGPIRKGKMWFFDGADGEYDNIVIPELPSRADHDGLWRVSNLAKVQTNLTSRNILTTSFLINHLHDEHTGLSPQNPISATPVDVESLDLATVKDQHYFSGGELLEAGAGFDQYTLALTPLGTAPYVLSPATASGNYYLFSHTHARRWQAFADLYLPSKNWHGRHETRFGVDLDRLTYVAQFSRQPISFLQQIQNLSPCPTVAGVPIAPSPCVRYSTFSGGAASPTHNFEASSYAQDRWFVTNRLLIEPGLRLDWDEIVRDVLIAPRLAGTYVLDAAGNTKLSAGAGVIYDATPLFLIARPFAGQRTDYFLVDSSGMPLATPISVLTTFSVNRNTLEVPRYFSWSAGIERKLPSAIYLKAEFMQRNGVHGFVYNIPAGAPAGDFVLQNTREDHYRALQIQLRRNFRESYTAVASYTRSKSSSNQVLDFNVDSPLLSRQAPGPYSWDSPNRFLSWGFLPFFKLPILHKVDLAYATEARSGFAFSVVNPLQQLVGAPNSRRFPTYFSLNTHLEKRFHFLGAYWAARGGFDNITGHRNPVFVNNNISSSQFLTFSDFTGRAFTTRIRFLGRK